MTWLASDPCVPANPLMEVEHCHRGPWGQGLSLYLGTAVQVTAEAPWD